MKTNAERVKEYKESIKRFTVQIIDLECVYDAMRFDPTADRQKLIDLGCHIDALTKSRGQAEKWRKAYVQLPAEEPDGFPCPF